MKAALTAAIEADALSLAYQPKIDLRTGQCTGFEALSRWDDADLGRVDPATFIALAEREELIDALTLSNLKVALADWRRWKDACFTTRLAFNLSAQTLKDVGFPDIVEHLCLQASVPPSALTLELTEGATQEVVCLMDTLTRFRIKGMGTALDDFGTGYSSLLQLRRLPFTELKIDQWFVRDAVRSDDAALVIKSIIDLAHGLGLTVIAEGVAAADQLLLLRRLGCDEAQGHLIAPPMAGDAVLAWIDALPAYWASLQPTPALARGASLTSH